jgi:hypothetical protein
MDTEFTPEPEDEVPALKQYEVNITLESLVTALVEKPRRVLEVGSGDSAQVSVHPDIAPHLQRISDLASELQQEFDLINQIDPDALNRLKQA